jgi:tetratricopeptide (TPR) repeat protein
MYYMISKHHKRVLSSIIILLLFSLNLFPQSSDGQVQNNFEREFNNARLVFHSTCFEKASTLFDLLLKEKQDHALSFGYAAMIDMLLYRDPSQNIQKARSLSVETDPEHLFTMALCSFAEGDLLNCELKLKEFLKKYPNSTYGMHVLGFTQNDSGRPEEGLKTLTVLISREPAYFPAYNHIGYAYLGLQEKEKALKAFRVFYDNDSLNPSALDSLAEGQDALGNYDGAIASLSRAVILDPGFAYGWKHMADIFKRNGESKLALNAYGRAINAAGMYGADFVSAVDKEIKLLKL